MDKTKRERSANFTRAETDILISIIKNYESIIESKQSDSTTWKEKAAAWTAIQKQFNGHPGVAARPVRTLRLKYEGIKRSVRKKSADTRSELDTVEEQVKSMMSLSPDDGFDKYYDTYILPQILSQAEKHCIPKEDKCFNSSKTKTYTTTPSKSSHKKFNVTSSNDVNSKGHPAINGNNVKETLCEAALTQAEMELVQLQKELYQAELVEKRKEWDFREKERNWKQEEYKLKLEKLRKKLDSQNDE